MKDVLSVGEKQLICLCRALLKNNKVLILDEASANIDLNTEKIIYDTINECCKEITVISIMHKKEYMTYFDTIIEMDNGRTISISNNKEGKQKWHTISKKHLIPLMNISLYPAIPLPSASPQQ